MVVSGPAALSPAKELRYPLDRRLGGPQSRSARCGEEKNLLPCQELNPGRLVLSPSLYQLSYLDIINVSNVRKRNTFYRWLKSFKVGCFVDNIIVVTSTWWEGLVLPMIPRAMPAGA
jgi:hypothetical protein